METVRLVLADDHPMFRDGLRTLLLSAGGFEIVAEGATGEEAASAALDYQPDVVVMDLRMPGIGGIEATRQITGCSPHIGVLVLTMFEDDDSVFAAMRAGARGYLVKEADDDEILRAIRAVANGEAIFGPAVARRVVAYFATEPIATSDRVGAFPQLTAREREVLDLVAQGANNTEIARRLYLSPRTARNHVSNIFTKLAVADRAQLIVLAREAGIGHGGSGG